MYLTSPVKGFFQLRICAWDKKTRMTGLPGRERSYTISLAVWIQYTNVTGGQTDGRTDGHGTTAKTALSNSVAR